MASGWIEPLKEYGPRERHYEGKFRFHGIDYRVLWSVAFQHVRVWECLTPQLSLLEGEPTAESRFLSFGCKDHFQDGKLRAAIRSYQTRKRWAV